jgi:hypothetical protein
MSLRTAFPFHGKEVTDRTGTSRALGASTTRDSVPRLPMKLSPSLSRFIDISGTRPITPRGGAEQQRRCYRSRLQIGLLFTWPADQPRHALIVSVPTSKPFQSLNHFPSWCHAPHAHGPVHISHASVHALYCFGAQSGQGTFCPGVAGVRRNDTSFRCSSVRC